jgi:hypothetical protein
MESDPHGMVPSVSHSSVPFGTGGEAERLATALLERLMKDASSDHRFILAALPFN